MKRRELEARVEELNAQISTLNEQLVQYRTRESAIVKAMTDAESFGAQRIADAEAQAKAILEKAQGEAQAVLEGAQAERAAAEDRVKHMEDDASARAVKLMDDMKADIESKLIQVEQDVASFQERLKGFTNSLNDAVRQARTQAETFAKALTLIAQDAEDLKTGGEDLESDIQGAKTDLPEQYENPQKLIQHIYKLQNRDLPAHIIEDVPEEAPEEKRQNLQPLRREINIPAEEAEERVWTVDEIIAQQASREDNSADDIDLDSLLDEIMK